MLSVIMLEVIAPSYLKAEVSNIVSQSVASTAYQVVPLMLSQLMARELP